jgi:hypothetical protein
MAPFKVLTWCKDMVEFEMDVIRFLILRKNLIFKVPPSPKAEILLWVTNPPHPHTHTH